MYKWATCGALAGKTGVNFCIQLILRMSETERL